MNRRGIVRRGSYLLSLGRRDTILGRGDTILARGNTILARGNTILGRDDTILGRDDTILSLLPNAGEGGRRPDEGARPRCRTLSPHPPGSRPRDPSDLSRRRER